MLGPTAAVAGEDLYLKGQSAFVKSINYEITGPKLHKTLEKPDCIFAGLVKVVELTKSPNLLKLENPVMTKYIADMSQESALVQAVGQEMGDTARIPEWRFPTMTPCPWITTVTSGQNFRS